MQEKGENNNEEILKSQCVILEHKHVVGEKLSIVPMRKHPPEMRALTKLSQRTRELRASARMNRYRYFKIVA